MKRYYWLILFLSSLLFAGCLTRETTRYNAKGEPWSKDRVTAFMVRGEVSALKEDVTETADGDYHRKVSLGALKGDTETDKLAAVAEAAAKGAVQGAAKAVAP